MAVVIYSVGSPIVVDIEESLANAGVEVEAAVKNLTGDSYLLDGGLVIELDRVKAKERQCPIVVPLFTPSNRQKALREARTHGFGEGFSLIDPTVRVPRSFRSGEGLYINAGCSLGAASELGEFVFINRGVSLGHHARLDRFVSIGPGAVIGSLIRIGKGALVGAGAVVLPKIEIGENAVVGAGAVVTKDVPANCVVVGNPARVVKEGITGYGGGAVD